MSPSVGISTVVLPHGYQALPEVGWLRSELIDSVQELYVQSENIISWNFDSSNGGSWTSDRLVSTNVVVCL